LLTHTRFFGAVPMDDPFRTTHVRSRNGMKKGTRGCLHSVGQSVA